MLDPRSGLRRPIRGVATLALLSCLGAARPSPAATRFVATTGEDIANTCIGSASPCRTITHAIGQATTGDAIAVAAGTYSPALGEIFPLRCGIGGSWAASLRVRDRPLARPGSLHVDSGEPCPGHPSEEDQLYQPLDTDSSYLADWGTRITPIGVDYYQQWTTIFAPGVSIGFNKYGRQQVGLKASYAVTPELSLGTGWTILWTDKAVDTDSIGFGPTSGALPSFVDRKTGKSARPEGESKLLGNELDATLTWRFAPGLDFDFAFGYLFAGGALGTRHPLGAAYCEAGKINSASCQPPDQKDRKANDVIITTARVRFSF